MVSQVDRTKWFELTEDSDTDDDLEHRKFSGSGHHSHNDLKKLLRSDDPSLSQYSLQDTRLSAGDADLTKPLKLGDPTLSQYSLGDQLSESDSSDYSKSDFKMDKHDVKKADVESLHLQFQTLLTDDSQEGDSTQLSSTSDQLGSTTDDPWRSATETSDGPSLSEYPLKKHQHKMADCGQTMTEDSSECEEVLHTAISEVSKDFISGNLSSCPLQHADSDLSSDDQKVLQRHLGGKYPETAPMSDSDWNVTDTDTGSPRNERKAESMLSSVSSFSPPFSSTILTNSSTVSGKPGHGLSIIQEASVETAGSFKELPGDMSVSTSKGSFLGRDHEKYIDSMRTLNSTSSTSYSKISLEPNKKGVTNCDFAESRKYENKELSPTSVVASFNKSSGESTKDETESSVRRSGYSLSSTTTSLSRDSPAGGAAGTKSQTTPYLDLFASNVDLARKSEEILDRTLTKLNLKGTGVSRYSYPFSNNSSPNVKDDYKRHSLGRLEPSSYTLPRGTARQDEVTKSLSGSTRLYHNDDLTRSGKSHSSDSSQSVASDEVARLMARSGSSAETTLSRADENSFSQEGRVSTAEDRGKSSSMQEDFSRLSMKDRSQQQGISEAGQLMERSQLQSSQLPESITSQPLDNMSSRVDSLLAQTSYLDRHSSLTRGPSGNTNNNHGQDLPPSTLSNMRVSREYLPPPPPPVDRAQLPPSDQPLPPPPGEAAASLDYQRLQKDLQEIQNSLHNNLDFDSGNDSQTSDVEKNQRVKTPVGSENGSDIIPSTTTTPERSRRLMWDYGADIACQQAGRFTSRESDATESEAENRTESYVDRAQVARNASRRHPYNSEGEETHTSGSSGAKPEDVSRGPGTDEEHHTSRTNTPVGRDADEILSSYRTQRSLLESQYLCGMANQVSEILAQQQPEQQAHGILSEVQSQEQEHLKRLANRPPPDSSFTDTSANVSSRSMVISDSDVRKRLEMSGLSSPDVSRTLGNSSFMEFSTPRKIANPFAAFSNAKTFLSSQLEEMSNKTFNHSIELRTPLRQVVECYPLYGASRDDQNQPQGGATSGSSSRTDSREFGPTDASQSRSDRGQPEGLSPDESPSRRLTPNLTASVESTQSITDRRAASSPQRDFPERFASSDTVGMSSSGERYSQGVSGNRGDTSSPTSTSPADLSQYKDKLRPYRPAGSQDLYYTESDTGSVADSMTTMESTHTGSDDAQAPFFPPDVLGSRGDGPKQPSVPRKQTSQGMQLEQALSTIEEKSVTEERDRTSIESSRGLSDQVDSRESLRSQDTKPERALDSVRSHSPRDTLSKLETRADLDMESGIGSRSNFTSTDSSQDRQGQSRVLEDVRHRDQQFSQPRRFENDETLQAARKVLQDIGDSGNEERRMQLSHGQFEGQRSKSRQEIPRTSSSVPQMDTDRQLGSNGRNPTHYRSGQNLESRSSQNLVSGSSQNVTSGLGTFSESRTSREFDSLRPTVGSRSGLSLESRSGQTVESRLVQLDPRSSHSLDTGSSQNLQRGSSQTQSSEQYLDSRYSGRDLQDHDQYESRLRSRSDSDLFKHRESSSPVREGCLPDPSPQQSPIHPHSTLRESQIRTDPRHSTAIESSVDQRQKAVRERSDNGHLHRESEVAELDTERGSSNGREGRPRLSDRKDTRQRMEQNRKARRGPIDVSSSEDDTNRAIDCAPVSRPAQILREALEQEVDPNVPVNINRLWERFQELNPTDSDTSLNTTRMEQLSHLLRNPAKHLVTSYFNERESSRKSQEDKAANERETRRNEKRLQKIKNTSESESNGSYIEAGHDKSQRVSKSSKKGKKGRVDMSVDNEHLYSIPEDISFDQRRNQKPSDIIDPNMEKLREKIERQKEKIERERRKELKRMEKLVKLESLLSAKKKGKISESTLMDQLEYISTTSAPTDSTEEITESTLTLSAANSETLTDDSTTAKDSSLEMQMVRYARNLESRFEDENEPIKLRNRVEREVNFEDRSRKAEKVRMNEKLKEESRSREEKTKRRSKRKEEEALYDFHEVDIQIVDKPRRIISPDSNKRSRSGGRMKDAGTNYPSPMLKSPQSERKTKQRRTKSEAIQTSPIRQRISSKRSPSPKRRQKQVSAPFSLQEKSRSRSPPYSRQFTPEAYEHQQPKPKQKMPASPKGIAWFVEVKEQRPWRQPLKERQAFAVRQAWVPERQIPERKSQWQTAQPGDSMNEDEENEQPLETRFLVDKLSNEDVSSKLIDENYTSKKTVSLQDAFNTKMQQFVSKSRERQKRNALAAEHRRMQEALRREREQIFADKRKQDANPNAHPFSENLLRPKKRVFTRQEQKDLTKKPIIVRTYRVPRSRFYRKYSKLPEVLQREETERRLHQYKLNRLKARVFTKRVQRHVLIKAGSY